MLPLLWSPMRKCSPYWLSLLSLELPPGNSGVELGFEVLLHSIFPPSPMSLPRFAGCMTPKFSFLQIETVFFAELVIPCSPPLPAPVVLNPGVSMFLNDCRVISVACNSF